MNIRANCCRCLGGLLRCLDGIACEQVEPNSITENDEFKSFTLSIVDAIILNVSTGKAMKVGSKFINICIHFGNLTDTFTINLLASY